MNLSELQSFLDEKVILYNNLNFIESDPIQIPHLFSLKEDIEIAGFLSATIAWGNRKMIINNSHKMMQLMGNSPYDFVLSHNENQLESLNKFVHRTFNGQDFVQFIKSLQHIYTNHNGLEAVFAKNATKDSMQKSISEFKKIFFENNHLPRTQKHISDPISGSAAKRINMFLRWMVRQDTHGVDFGLWKTISPSALSCPLDVHSGNVARKLQLLLRKQNDAKAVYELDTNLRLLDPNDPVKYDFALFGLGVFEKF
ncbi:TIGR02757 family protein [Flavobacterium psychrophilum]|uniref:TIGR02757 family protein n=1 Tax=Flavobacterium psychrophilum TaxID=96345 RepID=UPI00141BC1A5|nr:TIGR02757 family protein [Flavobacterium psychrophilum]ELY1979016.1 TIGR02757 family protein [Flavobacterium psychrophilum]MBF2092545.1 TIGR02757 family protein [Flavobacterium psychrophilum]MCB6230996.1 TIGR02757 family protein [Flavobacterium psychrophilum]MEB3379804.1 TIGR02757 family protein [Flavobacterium psychrophilum]